MVNGHELGAVGERAFDLDVRDHLRTPSMTASTPRIVDPRLMISATDRPSRISSRISEVISATASG
jgi:hypothetical protein